MKFSNADIRTPIGRSGDRNLPETGFMTFSWSLENGFERLSLSFVPRARRGLSGMADERRGKIRF